MSIFSFINIILKGISQIMLQKKATTGLFFLAGIFYESQVMGIAAIIASCCGTITAQLFNFKEADIQKGIYGFSPALTGVALLLFFKPTIFLWSMVVIGSIMAAWVQHLFIKWNVPVFTLPFVLMTWLVMYLAAPLLSLAPATPALLTPVELNYTYGYRGFAQVIFQDSTASGILFFAGVLVCSPAAALYGFIASLLAGQLALWLGMPPIEVAHGLWSFNAVLCAIAFAGWKVENFLWALLSVVLAVLIGLIMDHYKVIQLTFPFVAAACICTLLKRYMDAHSKTGRSLKPI